MNVLPWLFLIRSFLILKALRNTLNSVTITKLDLLLYIEVVAHIIGYKFSYFVLSYLSKN